MAHREGIRSTIASRLVRIGMTLDRTAAERALCREAATTHPATGSLHIDSALHW